MNSSWLSTNEKSYIILSSERTSDSTSIESKRRVGLLSQETNRKTKSETVRLDIKSGLTNFMKIFLCLLLNIII